MKRRLLAMEDIDPATTDTERTIAPEDSAEETGKAQDQPLEMVDVDALQVNELQQMQSEQEREENTQVIRVLDTDVPKALDHIQAALEHFIQATNLKNVSSLRLAAEQMEQAHDLVGMPMPAVVPTAEGQVLEESHLNAALESLGGTLSTLIKAIAAMIKKAIAFLKQFLKDCWRHLRSLDDAIERETKSLLEFRKKNSKRLLAYAQTKAPADWQKHVSLPVHKSLLLVDGKQPSVVGDGYAQQFMRMNKLAQQAIRLDEYVQKLPAAFKDVLDTTTASVDGLFSAEQIKQSLKLPGMQAWMGLKAADYTAAIHVHGLQAPDGCALWVGEEYMGNLFEIFTLQEHLPEPLTQLNAMANEKIEFRSDEARGVGDDFLRCLDTQEIKQTADAVRLQAETLISMQRIGDRVDTVLDQLSDFLKKVDAQVWQNNQGNAQVAAGKNQVLLDLARAAASTQTTCSNFFQTVVAHIRRQQLAWLSYLVANHKADLRAVAEVPATNEE